MASFSRRRASRVVDPEQAQTQLDLWKMNGSSTRRDRGESHCADSNRKIIEEIKKYALDHEERHGRFPKTLIFAVNDLPHTSHADQFVNICRDVFGRGDAFVQKITGGGVDRPLQRIREFRNRPDPPSLSLWTFFRLAWTSLILNSSSSCGR